MRPTTLAIACTLFLVSMPCFSQGAAPEAVTTPILSLLTLQEALARATRTNPVLRAKQAQLAAAEGVRNDARGMFFNNPQLSLDNTWRQAPQAGGGDERRREWGAGLSQAFETGGQGRLRRDAAAAALEALNFEIADTQRQVHGDVATRFYQVMALQQRVELEVQALKLFDDAATAVQKRRLAGEDTKLDSNIAMVEAERARNQLAVAQEQLIDARRDLAARLQLADAVLPQAQGDLAPLAIKYTLGELMQSVDAQPRLRALPEREKSAGVRLKLESASVYPDVTVGMNIRKEGPGNARERLTTLSISAPLPLFKRNAAGIGQAATEATQAQIELEAAMRDARASTTALWFKLRSQEQRVRRLQESVLPALAENLNLSVKSRQVGQIGLLELIVVNRQAVDARRDLIDALSDYHATRVALELAAGSLKEGNQP